jgi:hypothetical protein
VVVVIKFECDECGQIVDYAEAIGPGVLLRRPGSTTVELGKAFEYVLEESDILVSVQLKRENGGPDVTYCQACMWKAIKEMINDGGPSNISVLELVTLKDEEKDEIKVDVDVYKDEVHVYEDEVYVSKPVPRGTWKEHVEAELQRQKEIVDKVASEPPTPEPPASDQPDIIPDNATEVPNVDESDGVEVPDTQLHEVHTEGTLPETSSSSDPTGPWRHPRRLS